ncbi:polysaccharide pyruvyl transferase family protein [Mesobacillus foraminis]|uniref:polysaccharide pyruvyl transferase family protein n=1 Tax=Mesobacillus foraminis TaxID=279826 RepID=UPI000EF4E8CD|nr:polysaccharide pyruvyl transferase family protein [Mesobacillus foraminis]
MEKVVLYSHGGSGNRGCEAIVRSTRKIIGSSCNNSSFYLCSLNKEEDNAVNLKGFNDIIEYSNYVKKNSFQHIVAAAHNRLSGKTDKYITLAQKNIYKMFGKDSIAISIGGDNYCYVDSQWLHVSHNEAKKRNTKTVLWGCSLEEANMNDDMIYDLKNYDLIVARESITYNMLLKKGIDKNTKLYPDPAFQLETDNVKLPNGFIEGKTVGINLSPYIFKSKLSKEQVIDLYVDLIKHILSTTNMQIALIPHVFWSHNNDIEVMCKVYCRFQESSRVIFVKENYNCMQLKYIISKCRMFIGARTHSTIAAYSMCVPTLVLGYSVKSRGIARDIFGHEENMVIPVQELDNIGDLINAYEYLKENELALREHLLNFMPSYKEKALVAGNEVKKILIKS